MVRSASSLLVIGLLVFGGLGCGAGTGNVSGKVTLDDKPVPAGRVTFTQGSKTAAAEIKSDGSYEAQGVPAGEVNVAVINPIITSTPTDKKAAAMMKGMQKTVGKDATPTAVEAPTPTATIPTKYSDPEKSGLKVTVKRNETTPFDIELTK
jgi:hypothetical protein